MTHYFDVRIYQMPQRTPLINTWQIVMTVACLITFGVLISGTRHIVVKIGARPKHVDNIT